MEQLFLRLENIYSNIFIMFMYLKNIRLVRLIELRTELSLYVFTFLKYDRTLQRALHDQSAFHSKDIAVLQLHARRSTVLNSFHTDLCTSVDTVTIRCRSLFHRKPHRKLSAGIDAVSNNYLSLLLANPRFRAHIQIYALYAFLLS